MKNIATTVARQRRIVGTPRLKPNSLIELHIPSSFQWIQSSDGNTKFLMYDAGSDADKNRFLIFSTEKNLSILQDCEDIFSDGTFSITPNLFEQLYSIHGNVHGSIFPLVYVLMPSKKQHLYEEALTEIRKLAPNFNPHTIMTDFEKASINAYENIFTGISHRGCFFHLSQCIWRRLQRISEARKRYCSDPDFARNCHMIGALAFVPPEDVVTAFEKLEQSDFIAENDCLMELLCYFEANYIGKVTSSGRKTPLFPIK